MGLKIDSISIAQKIIVFLFVYMLFFYYFCTEFYLKTTI